MDHKKLEEFSQLSAVIGSGLDALLKAQELSIDLMCKYCDIPIEMKPQMIEDMNKVMGIKKL